MLRVRRAPMKTAKISRLRASGWERIMGALRSTGVCRRFSPLPLVTDRDNSVCQYARLQPLSYQADDAPVADPMFESPRWEPPLTDQE
jgi:hypothetical protein